jgi:flagellar hook-length control protein FliK
MSLTPLTGALAGPTNLNGNASPADKPAETNGSTTPFAQTLQRARQGAPRKAEAKPDADSTAKATATGQDERVDATTAAATTGATNSPTPLPAEPANPAAVQTMPAPITAESLLQAALVASTGHAPSPGDGEQEAEGLTHAFLPGTLLRAAEAATNRAAASRAAHSQAQGEAEPSNPTPEQGEDLKAQWQAQLGREAGPAALAPGASTPQAAAAAAQQAAQSSTPSAPPTFEQMAQAPISPQVGRPEFAPALSSQLTTFVREGIRLAELTLNPAEMGPVTVSIALQGQQAQVDFAAAHAATRVALEQSLPALASALHQAGFTLSGGGVSDQRPRGQHSANQEQARAHRDRLTALGNTGPRTGAAARRGNGLLDMFA